MTAPNPGLLLAVAPFARAANVSDITIRRLIRRGELRAVKLGRAVRIPATELARLVAPTSAR